MKIDGLAVDVAAVKVATVTLALWPATAVNPSATTVMLWLGAVVVVAPAIPGAAMGHGGGERKAQ